jgi:hypothetical protein
MCLRYRALSTLLVLLLLLQCGCGPVNTQFSNSARPGAKSPNDAPPSSASEKLSFARLINEHSRGRSRLTPWVGYWWPYSEGGTSTASALYEKATGRTGAADWEQTHHGPKVPGIQNWWGHCNGWAAAATLFEEPTEVMSENGVSFETADQKSLLSEISMDVNADFYGHRDDSDDPSSLTFQDIFPDQFFLVLTNYQGNGYPLIMDRYTGSQVWNQPIAGYVHFPISPNDVLPPDPSAPGVYRVNVTTQVWWARDDVEPDAQTGAFNFEDDDSFESRTYAYEVWLDGPVRFDEAGKIVSSGNVILGRSGDTVIGGVWKNGDNDIMNSHPDYMWYAQSISTPAEYSNPELDATWVAKTIGKSN